MTVCVVFLIVGGLLLLPIPFSAMGHISAAPVLYGGVSVRLFNFPVFTARVSIKKGGLTLTTAKGKEHFVSFSTDPSDPNTLVSHLDNGVARVIELRGTELYAVAGVSDDAMATAMLLTSIKVAAGAAAGYLMTRFATMSYADSYEPVYNADRLSLTFRVRAAMSIADALYSFWYAVVKKVRSRRKYVAKHA